MIVRSMRKLVVLTLAALGVQYLMMVGRIVINELHPGRSPGLHQSANTPRSTSNGARLVTKRVVITTLEPHGVL